MEGEHGKSEEIFRYAQEISAIAHHARLQAYEAEMRANFAVSLAEHATDEADAVQDIAETLTKTARVVAKLSLKHMMASSKPGQENIAEISSILELRCEDLIKRNSQSTNQSEVTDLKDELQFNLGLHDNEEFNVSKTSPLVDDNQCGSDSSLNFNQAFNNGGSKIEDTESFHSSKSLDISDSQTGVKYDASFPDNVDTLESKAELIRGLDSAETLSIVYEDSYQGPRENRSIPWSEKKSMRKLQRKLKDLEMGDGRSDLDHIKSPTEVIGQISNGATIGRDDTSMEDVDTNNNYTCITIS